MKNYGYKPDIEKIDDYKFGGFSFPDKVLKEDGQWDEFLPELENQNINGIETNGCVSFATTSIIEILFERLGKIENYSDRFLAIVSETDPASGGNTPNKVADAVRKIGLIDEVLLPFISKIDSVDKYYSPKPMTSDLIWRAGKWLQNWTFGYEKVHGTPEMIKKALRYSPLGAAVYAWQQNSEGLYVRPLGYPDVHYCVLYGYEDKKYFKIFDSYEMNLKKLDWNFNFTTLRRYYLEKKDFQETSGQKFLRAIKRYFHFIFS